MTTRFKDNGERLYQFADLFLVRCPRCDKRAEVILRDAADRETAHLQASDYQRAMLAPRRLVCLHCGYTKEWERKGGKHHVIETVDWFFGCPLWLQTPCCGHVLWAFNEQHLDFLESYVAAKIREGHPNGSIASRLPLWIKDANNREDVLRCIRALKSK